jgi:hypothetical protein
MGVTVPPFKQQIAYSRRGEEWSVGGMRDSGEHKEVFDLWSPATDKRKLCLCVCAVCGKAWNEAASAPEYPTECNPL